MTNKTIALSLAQQLLDYANLDNSPLIKGESIIDRLQEFDGWAMDTNRMIDVNLCVCAEVHGDRDQAMVGYQLVPCIAGNYDTDTADERPINRKNILFIMFNRLSRMANTADKQQLVNVVRKWLRMALND